MRTRLREFWQGTILVLAVSAALGGCGSGQASSSDQATAASARASSPEVAMKGDANQMDSAKARAEVAPVHASAINFKTRQIVRHADLDIRVENVEKSEKAVNKAVSLVGGYTENASSSDLASNHPQLNITVRVPVATFESTIERFEALGVRRSKTVSSEDVTGRIVDLDAQLKTLTAQEEVYRGMLKSHAKLSELLELQERLGQVRTQIEELSSQRKSQGELAALSTIAVTLEQNAIPSHPDSDPNWMTQSWAEATTGAAGTVRSIAGVVLWMAAYAVIWLPVLLIVAIVVHVTTRKKPPINKPPHSVA